VSLGLVVARVRAHRPEAFVPLAILVVSAIELLCKAVVAQPLPPDELSRSIDLLPAVRLPTPFAFPSGHVSRLTFLLSITAAPRWVTVAAILLMAATRVYLAEHWLSDVIGGVLLGLAVAWAARFLSRRGDATMPP